MQKKRRGDSLDHDWLSYSRSQVGPCQAATPCPGTLLQTLGKQLTRPIIQRHSLYSTLVPWSFGTGATPMTDPQETPKRAPGHRVDHIPYIVIQSSPPTCESFPSRTEEAGPICSHLYWLPQVNMQGAAWAGPQKYMGPDSPYPIWERIRPAELSMLKVTPSSQTRGLWSQQEAGATASLVQGAIDKFSLRPRPLTHR